MYSPHMEKCRIGTRSSKQKKKVQNQEQALTSFDKCKLLAKCTPHSTKKLIINFNSGNTRFVTHYSPSHVHSTFHSGSCQSKLDINSSLVHDTRFARENSLRSPYTRRARERLLSLARTINFPHLTRQGKLETKQPIVYNTRFARKNSLRSP